METQTCKVRRKPGFGSSDTEICREGKTETATNRSALHGSNNRLATTEHPNGCRIKVLGCVERFTCREIRPSTKVLSFSAQHHRTAEVIGIKGLKGIGNSADEVHRKEIIRRFRKFDDSDKVIADSYSKSII
jgi:hypothetical protein